MRGLRQIGCTEGGKSFILAPHVVFWKANNPEVLFLDAIVVSEGGVEPNKPKLQTFTLGDLGDLVVLPAPFEPFADFHPDNPKYAGKTSCIVQTVQ